MIISVSHGGDAIPKSPFIITVAPPLDLSKVKVQGLNTSKSADIPSDAYNVYFMSISPVTLLWCVCCVEVDVGKDQEFTVNTRGAGGQGKVDVKILSPSRRPIPCKVESGPANEVHSVKYIPPEEGPYKVDISYDENPVPGSPFTVEGVMPPDPTKVSV